MYANVCALSLFLTCGPYARLPAWAGENSPECLILLNKRHEEACQVLHGPCQSLLASRFSVSCSAPASALIRRRKWNVAAAASCCGSILLFFGLFFVFFSGCCFHGSFGCQPSLMTLHRQRKQRAGVLHSVNQTHLDHRHLHATAVPSTQKIHTDKLGTIWNFAAMRLLF